ncbi:molybdenum cofactor guanylyltransferase [Pleionea sediminis]|uniref:molybdenum cofactor guanylyltransferase n=1 Tax=Pleionea sediminis TaxID=2569479 RepID=UPI0011863EF6|nr:molybdenum cofactor guanylyltransferase [Pleionea sediminis]
MIGVVLTGGLSIRMKQDKATLQHPVHKHQTLLDYALEVLINAGCDKVIISGEKFGGLADDFPQQGPLSGLYSVANRVKEDRFLVIPVDMPLLNSELLKELIEHAEQNESIYFEDSQIPMLVNLTTDAMGYLKNVLSNEESDRSIKAFFRFIAARPVACSRSECLANVNTPEQLEQLNQIEIER